MPRNKIAGYCATRRTESAARTCSEERRKRAMTSMPSSTARASGTPKTDLPSGPTRTNPCRKRVCINGMDAPTRVGIDVPEWKR